MEYRLNSSCCKCHCFLGKLTPSLSLIMEISWYHQSPGFAAHDPLDFFATRLFLAFLEAHDAHGSMTPSFRIHPRAFAVLRVFSTSVRPNLACACASVSTVGSLVTLAFETSRCLLSTVAYCTFWGSHNKVKQYALGITWTDQLYMIYCPSHCPSIHQTPRDTSQVEVVCRVETDIGHFECISLHSFLSIVRHREVH